MWWNAATSTESQVQAFIKGESTVTGFDRTFVASYQFAGSGSYADRTGTLPNLVWTSGAPGTPARTGLLLAHDRWVETQGAAAPLTQRIARTEQFTLITTVASADSEQEAAIISLSGDAARRNFTLGQEQDHLTFYLRTPVTGESVAYSRIVCTRSLCEHPSPSGHCDLRSRNVSVLH